MPRSRWNCAYAATRPEAAAIVRPGAASIVSHSPAIRARSMSTVSRATRGEPAGAQVEQTTPPSCGRK